MPFRGKHGHCSMIISSPEQGMNENTAKRHKIRKRQIKTCRNTRSQKNQKGTYLITTAVKRKDDEGQNSVRKRYWLCHLAMWNRRMVLCKMQGMAELLMVITKNAKNVQEKTWTGNDNARLKLAVRAMYPQSEKDWENLAASLRIRMAEECRNQALEILKLNIGPKKSKTADVSPDVVGTLAYQIQADRFTRQYLKVDDGSGFFEEKMDIVSNGRKVAMMPSVTTFDSDDSYYPPCVGQHQNLSKEIFTGKNDETYRERQSRYVHKILKVKNQHGRNRANVAKPSFSKNYHLQVPTTQCHQNDSDKESERDEYFEEETD
ncbi:unnamed protein product [Brugia pahangi]|uniref:Myb-like domain-containing protein n=1 Tax=Brugia pahangi TaxID=6280 RepID=A0A0N4T4I4_BRUPA|nr:unnamed protein product [Brugia pahangi]